MSKNIDFKSYYLNLINDKDKNIDLDAWGDEIKEVKEKYKEMVEKYKNEYEYKYKNEYKKYEIDDIMEGFISEPGILEPKPSAFDLETAAIEVLEEVVNSNNINPPPAQRPVRIGEDPPRII